MTSLISEIQRACVDDTVSVETLLRRVKLAASKLGLTSLESWVDSELNGYGKDIPAYRILSGEPKAANPFNGWIPILIGKKSDPLIVDVLTIARVAQPISGLSDLIRQDKGDAYYFPLSPKVVATINNILDTKTSQISLEIPRGAIVGVIDKVRNRILDWTIQMEANGVVGNGISFNVNEVEKAQAAMTTFHIGNISNFVGNMGTGNSSGSISLVEEVSKTQVSEVKNVMLKLKLAAPDLVNMGADIALPQIIDEVLLEAEKSQPAGGRLRGLTEDARTALAGAAGNLTAEGALALLSGILKLLGG